MGDLLQENICLFKWIITPVFFNNNSENGDSCEYFKMKIVNRTVLQHKDQGLKSIDHWGLKWKFRITCRRDSISEDMT